MPSLRRSASIAPRLPLAPATAAALTIRCFSAAVNVRRARGEALSTESSAHAAIMLLLLGVGRQGTPRKLRWLGHVGTTILRPSVHRFREGTVSRDVGT